MKAADARESILTAAATKFAETGYAGTSVQDIISATNVSKPTLYYYFESKAGLYKALVDYAFDERLALMKQAAEKFDALEKQLVELVSAMFDFLRSHRDLTRIMYAAAFAAPGEIPENCIDMEKRHRNFEFVHSLVKKGLKDGALDNRFTSKELTAGIYGALSFNIMGSLFFPEKKLNRETARQIVRLFMQGAAKRNK